MSKVSWDANYSIHIEDIPEAVAFHLSKAIKEYMSKMDGGSTRVIVPLEQIVKTCSVIATQDLQCNSYGRGRGRVIWESHTNMKPPSKK